MSEYHVIGVMSGSSLDGLDVCATKFRHHADAWTYEILHAETMDIPEDIVSQLRQSPGMEQSMLHQLDVAYGRWIGQSLKEMIHREHLTAALIGIHGHTVFHDPEIKKTSVQIGQGHTIAQYTGIPVVDNFRMKDISLGGQGAPLVPAGEHHLLTEYDAFLNLGGICNLSVHQQGNIKAWDIAPCNQVFNHFAQLLGQAYDTNGNLAQQGQQHMEWINYLKSLPYFTKEPPKSLANQWTREVLKNAPRDPKDALATYSHFLALEITHAIRYCQGVKSVMVTGGGAYNHTLIDHLTTMLGADVQLIIPSTELIDFKEALIFGFLALLKQCDLPNVFASATGASKDSVSGDLHLIAS